MRLILRTLSMLCIFIAQTTWAENLRDPTRPVISPPSASSSPIQTGDLQAIIISSGRRLAIFNGRPLTVGSELAGLKVVAIEANAVHLAGPGGKMILFLFNQTIKQSARRTT